MGVLHVCFALLAFVSLSAAKPLSPAAIARRSAIAEVGSAAWQQVTTPCDPEIMVNPGACFSDYIAAAGNVDYPLGSAPISYPTSGAPWGRHITGPANDGLTYTFSWMSGDSVVGPPEGLPMRNTSSVASFLVISTSRTALTGRRTAYIAGHAIGGSAVAVRADVVDYRRIFVANTTAPYSYLSPLLSHAVVRLAPRRAYWYMVEVNGRRSTAVALRTLPAVRSGREKVPLSPSPYPLRVGLMADVGQTANSTDTRNYMKANNPDVIFYVGDYSYADEYAPNDPDTINWGAGTSHQRRWDSFAALWDSLLQSVPFMPCAGNHEIEDVGIGAVVNATNTQFSFPENYPFQAYVHRYPPPGSTSYLAVGTGGLYYATRAGPVQLVVLNHYIPFYNGTPQHTWAMRTFANINRKITPWLVVAFHAPPYHTYRLHYKNQECFMSYYEDMFYQAGVDVVINGHVHAWERTHPVYKYKPNSCAPIYVTVGDGGNVAGPYRMFVDAIDPTTNKTYCEGLRRSGLTPVEIFNTRPGGWGSSYARRVNPPGCPTLSFQPPDSLNRRVLVPLGNDTTGAGALGFCQAGQPLYSAHRDPSFGHATLDLLSDTRAALKWYRNRDGGKVVRDSVLLERLESCSNRR